MKRLNLSSALWAGLTATLIMTAVAAMAPVMGLPRMNIPGMLAGFLGVPVLIGWLMHFMIGTALALIYGGIFARQFSRAGLLDGTVFGLLPWLMTQVAVMPMMGMGLFSGSATVAAGSLIGHLVYGAVLGAVYRPYVLADDNCEGQAVAHAGSTLTL